MTAQFPSLKYAIKLGISYTLYYAGLLQLWQAVVMRRKAVVLMYHRVLKDDEHQLTGSHPAIVVDQKTFAAHMALLKRRFNVLSLEEFASCLENKVDFPDRSCVITFDDGWRDNFTNALPVLRRYDLPALIFLPANYVGCGRLFWPEALTHLLCTAVREIRRQPTRRATLAKLLDGTTLGAVLDIPDADPRATIIEAVRTQRGGHSRAQMEALVTALGRALGVQPDQLGTQTQDGFMNWGEVEAMSASGVAFGGHGAEHHLLTQVSPDEVRSEIGESKRMLDTRLNAKVATFSYPNGYWTPEIRSEVEAAGFRVAFVTRRGFVSCDDDPLTVKRLNVHEAMTGSNPMFLARVVGLL